MVFTSFPRHQFRAQGRRQGRAGITITSATGFAQQKWHPHLLQTAVASGSKSQVAEAAGSLELLDFLSLTAVDSENQLLSGTWEPGFVSAGRAGSRLVPIRAAQPDAPHMVAASGANASVSGGSASLLSQLADSIFSVSEPCDNSTGGLDIGKLKSIVECEAGDAIAAVGTSSIKQLEAAHALDPLEHLIESAVLGLASQSVEAEFELVKSLRQKPIKQSFDFEFEWARTVNRDVSVPTEVSDALRQNLTEPTSEQTPIGPVPTGGEYSVGSDLDMAERLDMPLSHVVDGSQGDDSAGAFRSMLKELNEWLSASHLSSDGRHADESSSALDSEDLSSLDDEIDPTIPIMLQAAYEADPLPFSIAESLTDIVGKAFSDANVEDGAYPLNEFTELDESVDQLAFTGLLTDHVSQSMALPVVSRRVKHQRQIFRRNNSKAASTRTLDNGRRFECYDSGAVVEKDELGRVTQIRAASGGCVSIYYDRDGSPEGFLRTDRQGRSHSIAECDRQGVIVRDPTGRIRAAGDALCIDPNGCLSVCRSDGQFWSIDLVRDKHIERRRLADAHGGWNIITAVFAADGFRMTTLFQPVVDLPSKEKVNSVEDANRLWSAASVASPRFRFYGRDGSVIQFESEDELTNLTPSHVWSPGTRRVQPIWKNRHQAGTAWESVQEYVSSYLSN